MEVAPKRARLEEPVKQGFNFNRCPNELKLQILSKVDPDAALELLQINRFTRNYVLENRSYLESIKIQVAHQVRSYLSIKYKGSNKEKMRLMPTASSRFPRVHSTDLLTLGVILVCMSSEYDRKSPREPPARLWQMFPNLKLITELKTDLRFNVVAGIFKHSRAQIIDATFQFMQVQNENSFIAFSRDHLKLCKRIGNFQHSPGIWNFFKTTSFEHISLYLRIDNDSDVLSILQQVLDDGRVPSRAVTAELQYDLYKGYRVQGGIDQTYLLKLITEMQQLGPIEPLTDPPAEWVNKDSDSCNWKFRLAVTAQHELCMWVYCREDTLKLHIMHRPIAKTMPLGDA